jgi:hypothetical protein
MGKLFRTLRPVMKKGVRKRTGCGLRVTGCGLRVAGCGLREAGMRGPGELRVACCGLRVTCCGLREAGMRVPGGLRVASYVLREAGMRVAVYGGLASEGQTFPVNSLDKHPHRMPRGETRNCATPCGTGWNPQRLALRKLASRNSKPVTRNSEPVTRNSKLPQNTIGRTMTSTRRFIIRPSQLSLE